MRSFSIRQFVPLAFLLLALPLRASADDVDFFSREVASILENHCVTCHQGDRPKGGLDLTTAKKGLAGGDTGPLLEIGRPDDSLILQKISGDAPSMPKGGPKLAARDVAAIRRWIEEGALWPEKLVLRDRKLAGTGKWWSLKPLVRPAVPDLADDKWARTPLDRFVLAKLREQGLKPSPETDRRTLIRRVTFDLIGLPPTPAEVEAFLADKAPDAYERLVDQLLDSPRYGERWGRHWLDLVHFGESHGYDKDKPRPNAWPYRDYVIAAFNDDLPYDRFVEEQLAGDVLFPDDPRGVVATGFIAAGPWDFVGHVELREGTLDKKITRSNDRDDMVATAMSTFQSLTVHCARCHNHKFDPISQEDYYRLQAVFAGVDRADRMYDPDPARYHERRALLAERDQLKSREKELADRVALVSSDEIRGIDRRLAELRVEREALPKASDGEASPTNGYHSGIEPRPDVTKWVQIDLGREVALDQIVLIPARPTDFPDTPGFGFPARFRVEISNDAQFSAPELVTDETGADFANPGDKPIILEARGRTVRFIRVTATRLWLRTNDYIFALAELQALSNGKNLALAAPVTALDSIEAGRWSTKHLVDAWNSRTRAGNAAELAELIARREKLDSLIAQQDAQRTAAVNSLLDESTRTSIKDVSARLSQVEEHLGKLPAPQAVYAASHAFASAGSFTSAGTPRPVFFLNRGSDKSPGREMEPGTLSCLPELPAVFDLKDPADEGSRRAALAKWIVDHRNPLTRRSIVNRIWQYHFGRGIVESPSDFGHMGSLPTHPELLDWLAVEFTEPTVDLGSTSSLKPWSIKRLHRLILQSAVYRQSSAHNPAAAAVDSGNQFLWRMNRQRLEAEAIRDSVLHVTGKIDLRMGGPSDQQFYFKDDHSPIYDYERFDVDSPGAYRRSVFRFIVRSVPDPFMECLDCADPSLLTPRRNTTLTALQALSLLNNQFMVRQAEHFADRLRTISDDPARQIAAACELALSRPPTRDEVDTLTSYIARHGLANACRVIINSNEFVFVD